MLTLRISFSGWSKCVFSLLLPTPPIISPSPPLPEAKLKLENQVEKKKKKKKWLIKSAGPLLAPIILNQIKLHRLLLLANPLLAYLQLLAILTGHNLTAELMKLAQPVNFTL